MYDVNNCGNVASQSVRRVHFAQVISACYSKDGKIIIFIIIFFPLNTAFAWILPIQDYAD